MKWVGAGGRKQTRPERWTRKCQKKKVVKFEFLQGRTSHSGQDARTCSKGKNFSNNLSDTLLRENYSKNMISTLLLSLSEHTREWETEISGRQRCGFISGLPTMPEPEGSLRQRAQCCRCPVARNAGHGGEWEGTGGRGDGHSATTLAAVAALAPPVFDLPPPPRWDAVWVQAVWPFLLSLPLLLLRV